MNLFAKSIEKTDIKKIEQLRSLVYQTLNIDRKIPISISQLRCQKANCPPKETVIAILTKPLQQYKIHKSVSEITETDITQLLQQ